MLIQNQKKKSSRYTIGYLFDNLFEDYMFKLWSGITMAAEELDVNLVCYGGGSLDCPASFYKERNTLYDLLDSNSVDGLISTSGSLGNYITMEQLKDFYRRFSNIPLISIGVTMEGYSSIVVDNTTGMRALFEHMINVHGFRRIAFIKGPEGVHDAELRYQVYREVLEQYNIPYDPSLVLPGNFERFAGRDAALMLIERKTRFDAVVAANDIMALYAMKELKSHGYKVPQEIGMGGFDNAKECHSLIPALTTVEQPLFEMGKYAMKQIIKKLDGVSVPDEFVFPTKLIVRRSCGCFVPMEQAESPIEPPPLELVSDDTNPGHWLKVLIERRFQHLRNRMKNPEWSKLLAESALDDLRDIGRERFLHTLERLIIQGMDNDVQVVNWYHVINFMFEEILKTITEPEEMKRCEELLKTALIFVGVMAEQLQAYIRVRSEEENVILHRINQALITTFNEFQLKQLVLEEIPKFGIKTFYTCLYTGKDGSLEARKYSRIFLHYDHYRHVENDHGFDNKPFRSVELMPGGLKKGRGRYSFMVMPLYFKREQLGFYVCDIGDMGSSVYETLTTQLSGALKGAELVGEVQKYTFELEQKVEERTSQLKETQEQLIDSAHQAGMAEIAIGVMHNIGNILNSVNVSTEAIIHNLNNSKLSNLLKANQMLLEHKADAGHYLNEDPKGKLLPEYYQKLGELLLDERAKVNNEASGLLDNVNLIKEIVDTLQNYAKGGLYSERVNVFTAIDAALKIQESNLLKKKIKIEKKYTDVESIVAQKSKLIHIFINILKNGAEALVKKPLDDRKITIEVSRNSSKDVIIRIADNGMGIRKDDLKKIFQYGFSTKDDGHGFGLHTCAIYMSELGGSLYAESDGPGMGAAFVMVFPNKESKEHL